LAPLADTQSSRQPAAIPSGIANSSPMQIGGRAGAFVFSFRPQRAAQLACALLLLNASPMPAGLVSSPASLYSISKSRRWILPGHGQQSVVVVQDQQQQFHSFILPPSPAFLPLPAASN